MSVLRIRAEVIRGLREHLDERGFVGVDAPIFNSAAAEGTATLFPVEYFDSTVYLSQTGQLHMEAAAQALGRGVLLRPDLPGGEVQDAPSPDRVLDARARDGLRAPRRGHGPHGEPGRRRRSSACSSAVVPSSRRSSATSNASRGVRRRPSRASPTTKRWPGWRARKRRSPGARTSARRRRTRSRAHYDQPVLVHRFPARDQGLLHASRSRTTRGCPRMRHDRPGGLRRDHRRRRAQRRSRLPGGARSPRRASRRRPTSGTWT